MAAQPALPSNPAPPAYQTHPSRRDNPSVSSNHSRGGSRSQPAVESAVTRLLVAIKQLLEALSLWSSLKVSESEVSDVYVRLGNDFNAAVAAFGQFNIDMAELLTVPQELREVLERCLSEDATPANLDLYLPTVRKIITNLLQGLRNKQSLYRRIVSERRHRSTDTQGSQDRPDSRSSKPSRTDSASSVPSRYQSQNGVAEEAAPVRNSLPEERSRRRAPSTTRKREQQPQPTGNPPLPPSHGEDYFGGGFRPPLPAAGEPAKQSQVNGRPPVPTTPDVPSLPRPLQDREDISRRTPTPTALTSGDPPERTLSPPPVTTPRVPANVIRYSLIDKPVPSEPAPTVLITSESPPSVAVPSVVIDPVSPVQSEDNVATFAANGRLATSTPPPDTPPADALQAPAIASSLAALKKSEALERRASKRFSTYNISKITGGGVRDRSGSGRSSKRRSVAVESSNLTAGDLDVLTEVDESPSKATREPSRSRSNDSGSRSRAPTPRDETAPPLPAIPADISSTPETTLAPLPKEESSAVLAKTDASRPPPIPSKDPQSPEPASSGPSLLTVFLQVGKEVKKVTIEPGVSFSTLRVLFVDKFSYSPGQGNFPSIYIRDPSSGVQYELEDVDEVKDKCLLSLNVEPLDQVKQHIDVQMGTLAQELRELRSAFNASRRMSHVSPAPIITQPSEVVSSSIHRPSEKQWQMVARRLSHIVANEPSSPKQRGLIPSQPQSAGGSVYSESSGRIVTDLKTQFDEVQNLRRDLGVMRQLYTDFMGQTKDSLGLLRTQTQNVRQLADAKVGGARAYINSGKTKLDSRSQNVLTRVEELQDTVENLKDDVLKRHISPKAHLMKQVTGDISEVDAELGSLKEYISTIKPMWKKTWEEELQNIVEEQQFLTHQEEFLNDLLEDHKALMEVFSHVKKVVSLRGTGVVKPRGYRPPPPDEGQGGIDTVMMEIRGAAVDPERRLKAIAANQKSREKELANRSDEFEAELRVFVGGKKLKLTGGAEEAERVRQKRSDLALKAMFSNTNGSLSTGSLGSTGDSAMVGS